MELLSVSGKFKITIVKQNNIDKKSARLILVGHWLYDNIKPMTTQIFAINYDYWFDLDEGYQANDDKETLNENGEQYVFLHNCDDFFKATNFPFFGGLTLREAKETASKLFQQPITWEKPLTNEYT